MTSSEGPGRGWSGLSARDVDPPPFMPGLDSIRWADAAWRAHLVAGTRWLLLGFLSLYGLLAGCRFMFSEFGFFLTGSQVGFLLVSVGSVIFYNFLLHTAYSTISKIPLIDHLQIILDLFFITILVHFSGGAASWFWPVYLIATIEAAFLLPRQSDVWLVGAVGGAVYGLLLLGYYTKVLPVIPMPFVPSGLSKDGLYLSLTWFWVALLNSAVAIISAYLMSVIREEYLALGDSQERLQNFVDTANDLIFSVTPEGYFQHVNPVWRENMGYSIEELGSLPFYDLIAVQMRSHCLLEFRRALSGEKDAGFEGDLLAKDGAVLSVEGNIACTFKDGNPSLVWFICRDTTQRKATEKQLYQLAHCDPLTGLPNRASLKERVENAVALANRLRKHAAVLFLDLDRFKLINDTLGHAVGDELLAAVGGRLKACIREVDAISRVGGDEFIIVLLNLTAAKDAGVLAAKLLKALSKPFFIGSHELYVTASIGISVHPNDSVEPEALMEKADIAMYHAKRRGRNNHQFYNARMDENAGRRLLLMNHLRRGIERGEFRVYYQPKLNTGTGQISGLEALVRWEHPEFGLLPPDEFIPLAEETGLILPLGEWVLRSVAEQHLRWAASSLPPVTIAVNLSGYQLQQASFVDTVRRLLSETGMDPRSLEFEITESVLMQNPDLAENVLKAFNADGIRISIDDFGTGYSSLAHLKRFSVSALKIDKSFVHDVEWNATDAAIATAIIAMGSSLNLQIIAEGVETQGQLEFLRDRLCSDAQGYLFSKPVPADEITRFMEEHRPGVAVHGSLAGSLLRTMNDVFQAGPAAGTDPGEPAYIGTSGD
ncbi:MAG: EAL domain-containing protein [Holophagaceae bacterium]|nr:EAL domain-containing protein [Holophagaceae bacterium]